MALDRSGHLVLIETASTDPENPPVICENPPKDFPPPSEEYQWRKATDEEYAAYVAYWDRYYDRLEATGPCGHIDCESGADEHPETGRCEWDDCYPVEDEG